MTSENPVVAQIHDLFRQVQEIAGNKGSIKEARRLTRQIARMVAQVGKVAPNTDDHADAINWLEYATLAASRLSRRKDVQAILRAQAYGLGARSLTIRMGGKRDRGVAFNAYNLGIDQTDSAPEGALVYLLISRSIIKHVDQKKEPIPTAFRLNLNHGIAKCYYNLGQKVKAARILRATLGTRTSNTGNWSELRGYASCEQLLAQIILDNLDAKRAK